MKAGVEPSYWTRHNFVNIQNLVENNMNYIRQNRLNRGEILLAKVSEYTYLTTVQNIKNLEYYALEFGCYTSKTRSANCFKKNTWNRNPIVIRYLYGSRLQLSRNGFVFLRSVYGMEGIPYTLHLYLCILYCILCKSYICLLRFILKILMQ